LFWDETAWTPISVRALIRGFIGLCCREASPVSVTLDGSREAIPASSLMVVPELAQSMAAVGDLRRPPRTMRSLPSVRKEAPNCSMPLMVAWVSPPMRGRRSLVSPLARPASTSARWVWLLEGVAGTVPWTADGLTTSFTPYPPR